MCLFLQLPLEGHVSATSATFSSTVSIGGEIIGTTIGLGVAAPLGQLHISANAIADKVSSQMLHLLELTLVQGRTLKYN